MAIGLWCIRIIILWLMSWQPQNWMPLSTDGWPLYPTIFQFCTDQGRVTQILFLVFQPMMLTVLLNLTSQRILSRWFQQHPRFPKIIETISMSADVVEYDEDTTSINNMTLRDWRHHQTRDPIIEPFLRTLTQGRRPSIQTIPHSSEAMSLYREFDHLKLHRGVLYHSTVVNGVDKLQLVLPAKFWETALRGLHDDTGHMGRNIDTSGSIGHQWQRVWRSG